MKILPPGNPPALSEAFSLPHGENELTPVHAALRNKWAILGFATAVAVLTYVLLRGVQPLYTAGTSIMIDPRQVQLMGQQQTLLANQNLSESWTRTQMELLNSPKLAANVVQALDLAHNRSFQDCPGAGGLLGKALAWLPQRSAPPPCRISPDGAAKTLLGQVMAFSNDRSSYIIKTIATTSDPQLSAQIANAYAQAYVDWQRDVPRIVAEKADELLRPYLQQMRARVQAANAAVEQYRQVHGLVPIFRDASGSRPNQTLNSQSLAEANSELSVASNQLTDKQSSLQQIQRLLREGGQADAIAPVLASPVIQGLLQHRAEFASNLDVLRTRLLPAEPQVISAQAQLARNEKQIRIEIDKTVASLSSEVAALTVRKAALTARVADLQLQVAAESRDDVALQALLREAQAESSAYEAMLVRLKQIGAERLVQRGEAQIVVEASPPDIPSYPKKSVTVAGSFMGSLCIGVGLAFAHGFMSRRFRNAEQVEGETGLLVLGLFPEIRGRSPQDAVVDAPLSFEADSVRSVLAQVYGPHSPPGAARGEVVLVTSALPAEGKTSFSVALGRCAMQSGLRTFILDCDLRQPALERAILGDRYEAGGERDIRPHSPADLIAGAHSDDRSGLRFLALSRHVSNPHGLLAWPGLPDLIAQLRRQYDLVVLDTPPVLAVPDVLQFGPLAKRVLLMIDWRKTPRSAVVAATRALRYAGLPPIGAVMTKVDLRRYAKASSGNIPHIHYDHRYHKALKSA